MKLLYRACVILLSLIILAACNQHSEESYVIEKRDFSVSQSPSEKAQAALIGRLEAIISVFENVSDTKIVITTSEETGKTVDVSITVEINKMLTDEQKEAIINIITASCDDVEADHVHITES